MVLYFAQVVLRPWVDWMKPTLLLIWSYYVRVRFSPTSGRRVLHHWRISKPPVRIGPGVVLHLLSKYCKNESAIKTFHSHRTGSRGPEAVIFKSRAALTTLQTVQGHTHLNADLSVLGIASLTSATFKKRKRLVGVAVESACRQTCWVECGMSWAMGCVDYRGIWRRVAKARQSTGLEYRIRNSHWNLLEKSLTEKWNLFSVEIVIVLWRIETRLSLKLPEKKKKTLWSLKLLWRASTMRQIMASNILLVRLKRVYLA